ncbi:N-acetyltransferase [Micromonospora phytophila]|uniref:GNAT family N-acetyltransferase n=1 Tax=Micromonospora phytophila TaxID=709888 RepID=UPI00202F2F3D|nr:GNAT family N-acetyltransferase [Micromonospora phytophila]MCM0676495.1 N-acetyltransferase [Micromonospora phytophila]
MSDVDMIVIRNNPELKRYEALVDGALAGFADYHLVGDRVVFTHTEVDAAYEGRGLGSRLVGEALDDVRRQGRFTTPLCPFVASYLRRHAEYADLVRHP